MILGLGGSKGKKKKQNRTEGRGGGRTKRGLQRTRTLGGGPGTQPRVPGGIGGSGGGPPHDGWTPEAGRVAGGWPSARSCWKTRVRLPGVGGPGRPLPVGKPKSKKRGKEPPHMERVGRESLLPLRKWPPAPPAKEGRRQRRLWTPALVRREVNLNWSYRGSC